MAGVGGHLNLLQGGSQRRILFITTALCRQVPGGRLPSSAEAQHLFWPEHGCESLRICTEADSPGSSVGLLGVLLKEGGEDRSEKQGFVLK